MPKALLLRRILIRFSSRRKKTILSATFHWHNSKALTFFGENSCLVITREQSMYNRLKSTHLETELQNQRDTYTSHCKINSVRNTLKCGLLWRRKGVRVDAGLRALPSRDRDWPVSSGRRLPRASLNQFIIHTASPDPPQTDKQPYH